MRKTRSVFFFFCCVNSILLAQTSTLPPPKPTADYSGEAFVTETFRESFRFESDGTGTEQVDSRVKVNSDAGVQALGQLKVGNSALSDKLEKLPGK